MTPLFLIGQFNKVHALQLTDSTAAKPNREDILKGLRFFEDAGPNDAVLVFLASHGFSDRAGNFYFVPRDASMTDIDAVLNGANTTGKTDSLISWQDFFQALRRSAGHRLLIVDTCQAQNVAGTFDAHSLQKRSSASEFALMVASKGAEESQEYPVARHGLFTYALLDGLGGKADGNKDQILTANEVFGYLRPLVEQLRDKRIGQQTPQFMAPEALREMRLVQYSAH